MRFRSSVISIILAALLVAMTALPLAASAQEPTAERWYLKGDYNLNGMVDPDDARSILRIAGYLDASPEAGSPLYDAADFDQDGVITSKDARSVLRVSALLDSAPAQVQRTSVPIDLDAAIALINADTNALKDDKTKTEAYLWPFAVRTVSKVATASADNKNYTGFLWGGRANPLTRQIDDELNSTVNAMLGDTTETDIPNIAYGKSGRFIEYGPGYYKKYLEVLGASYVMKMDAAKSLIKDVKYYPTATGEYEIIFYFKDEAMSDDASQNLLANVMSVTLPSDASSNLGLEGEGVSFGTITDVYKNAHIKYKFQNVYNENRDKLYARPILAEYYYEMALSIPVTMSINIEGRGLGGFSMTLNTTNMVTKIYTFDQESYNTLAARDAGNH